MMDLYRTRRGILVNCAGNVSCELLRRLLEAAWDEGDAEKAQVLSVAVDRVTLQCLRAENAKTI